MTHPNPDSGELDKLLKDYHDLMWHFYFNQSDNDDPTDWHWDKAEQDFKKKLHAHIASTVNQARVELVEKIQTLANDFDLPNITTWKQGRFIDMPRYNTMGAEWKKEQEQRELTLIRPYGGTNNALFQVSGTGRATDIAAYLEEIGFTLATLSNKENSNE